MVKQYSVTLLLPFHPLSPVITTSPFSDNLQRLNHCLRIHLPPHRVTPTKHHTISGSSYKHYTGLTVGTSAFDRDIRACPAAPRGTGSICPTASTSEISPNTGRKAFKVAMAEAQLAPKTKRKCMVDPTLSCLDRDSAMVPQMVKRAPDAQLETDLSNCQSSCQSTLTLVILQKQRRHSILRI